MRVYINMDEEDEDEGHKNVELEKLFLREDSSLPYFIDVSSVLF